MYRQAIVTKYLGPTRTRGARIVARAQAGRKIYAWDHALDVAENHVSAAKLFADSWGWTGKWRSGVLPSGEYCHVKEDGNPEGRCEVNQDDLRSLQNAVNLLRWRGRALKNEADTFAGIDKEKFYRGVGLIEASNELQEWLNEVIKNEPTGEKF